MARKRKKPNKAQTSSQPEEVLQPPPGQPVARAGAQAGTTRDDPMAPVTPEEAELRSKRAFFGRSAQLAVMAELLHRRINVAIPEVDVGDDVFVVKGVAVEVTRVQVKGATGQEQQNSYFALINVPEDQLSVPQDNPPLVYVFPIRRGEGKQGRWSDFIVIRRGTLFARYVNQQAGKRYRDSKGKPYIQFRIVLTETTARSGPGQVNFQSYREAWNPWPPPWLADEEEAPGQIQRDDGGT
jgi:hypothetical protein